ncbi:MULTISPECIES: LysR substrate-binding domain-containing protein [Rhizobium/Agrobacterium group]|jgi:LysR family glycine cleavage system transcriptional activator|uniref:LysR family transcriptional regulator n=2 Tax=Rhizobium/Agrobacterium group TaxID=227290 RepID=A0AB36ETP2_AGRTU|nr:MULTISPECIES: LysR substrate-binding domain-containing protein [Rhizobium/Agrobacterium group]EHJ98764.1 transcriptional regulator, LysR family protein [Agrobacterium tumefaciens 5A]MDP9561001.1 LysR family glycine cleavage system transcriptional activator [Rhizobium nepotum]HCV71611.1 LysR family transcriptional regulator [Agrobacterium sp.]AYM11462.1 LysR family transcriptional regulator, glycine cleavage system transcriptional activator [Agrobacterium tumefaciens]KAA3505004.1 LysR family
MKMSRQFPLNALRVFEAAARHLSFTKAGEELGMTQTAVSYQVKLLEENVGEPLFIRKARQVVLTEAGQKLAPKVAEAFNTLREAVDNVRDTSDTTLTIHSTATFASRWLSRHLGAFQLEHPSIAVRLDTSSALIDFTQSDCDVAIRWSSDDGKGLIYHQLLRGVYTPMLHPNLAESIGGLKKPEDLLRLRIIDPGDIWWSQWFREVGIENPGLDRYPRSRLSVQAFEAAAAIASQGVAMLTPELYADEIALGRLYQPFEHLSNEGKNYWLVYPENRRNIRKIRLFRDWILKRIDENRPQTSQYPISGA